VEVVASLPQGRTAAAQCGLFTHKSVPVIFEPPCTYKEQNVLKDSVAGLLIGRPGSLGSDKRQEQTLVFLQDPKIVSPSLLSNGY